MSATPDQPDREPSPPAGGIPPDGAPAAGAEAAPDGPPAAYLLFLHGAGGSPMSWEEQVSRLPATLPARAPWLRGLRPGARDEFDVRAAAGDVLMALQLEGVAAGALAGHGLGALVAVQAALDAPELVSHLVLVAPQPPATAGARRAQRWLLGLVPRRRFADAGVDKDKVRDALRPGGALDVADASQRLDEVAVPTLVVVGSRSKPQVAAARALAAGIPGARLEIVEGAGADVLTEVPAAVNELLYGFLGHAGRGA